MLSLKMFVDHSNVPSKSDTSTSPWRLVHLPEDQSDLGLAVEVDDTSLLHFVVEIVALTGTLAYTGEHRETTVSLGNVVLSLGQHRNIIFKQLV